MGAYLIMLRNNNSHTKGEITVKKQVVAGFVIFRRTEDGIKYLLLYKRGEYWNFPKGHFEEGEKSLDTAFREVEEETGLKKGDLRVLPDFRAYEKFHFFSGTEKIYDTVILYLAETEQPKITISPREHSGYAWFLYSDATKILRRYAETRKVLKQAHDFIRGKNNPKTGPRTSGENRSPRTSQNARPNVHYTQRPGPRYGQQQKQFFREGNSSSQGNTPRPHTQLPRSGQTSRFPTSQPSRRQHPQFVRRPQNNHPLPPSGTQRREPGGLPLGSKPKTNPA